MNEYIRLRAFYQNELTNQILAFWLPRCEDKECGGYVNCFDNSGEKLISYDKYTWSQGRFVWLFSRLASTKAEIFSAEQRREFLRLAKVGRDFLMAHCLLENEEYLSDLQQEENSELRCAFLMERDGTHKHVDGCEKLDMSIYADCFVVLGIAAYASAAGDKEGYRWASELYDSVLSRIKDGRFDTLPYPLSAKYRAHGIPMILLNVTKELYDAALILEPHDCPRLKQYISDFADDILTHFVDEKGTIHEVITAENQWTNGLLGQHARPGHAIEDMWFMMDAADLLDRPEMISQISKIVLRSLEIGWDEEYGGILLYSHVNGGPPTGELLAWPEPAEHQVLECWGDKLWWVHSEALYTTLLCYCRTGEKAFWEWHEKVFDYTFRVFPNKNPDVREWKQICKRDGSPQDKVVALPVKDPFHIVRNLILIIELLEVSQRLHT